MVLAFLIFGAIAGLAGAATVLMAGGGFFLAFLTYSLLGSAATLFAAVLFTSNDPTQPAPQAEPA